MAEYIEREAAIEIAQWENDAWHRCRCIAELPAADVAPVVHGRWVGTQYDGYADGYPVYDTWECSVCHSDEYESEGDPPAFAYCPNCGAKMDGGN